MSGFGYYYQGNHPHYQYPRRQERYYAQQRPDFSTELNRDAKDTDEDKDKKKEKGEGSSNKKEEEIPLIGPDPSLLGVCPSDWEFKRIKTGYICEGNAQHYIPHWLVGDYIGAGVYYTVRYMFYGGAKEKQVMVAGPFTSFLEDLNYRGPRQKVTEKDFPDLYKVTKPLIKAGDKKK